MVEDDEEENEENQIDNRHIKPEVINEEVESADGESHVKNDDFLRDGLQKEYDDLLAEYRASVQVLDDSRVENDDHLTDDPQNEFDDMWVDVVRAGTAAHRPNQNTWAVRHSLQLQSRHSVRIVIQTALYSFRMGDRIARKNTILPQGIILRLWLCKLQMLANPGGSTSAKRLNLDADISATKVGDGFSSCRLRYFS